MSASTSAPRPAGSERFDGCVDRLNRAAELRGEFGDEWTRYLDYDPYEVFVDIAQDGRGRVGIRRDRPFPPRLPLLIGEFLYELRAALDNCLYVVAALHSGEDPPPGEAVLQFPIYDDRAGWQRNLYRLKHLSDEHRRILERIQPYNAERQDRNCLSMLNRLARIDRHRALHLVGAAVVEGGLLLQAPPGAAITNQVKVSERPVVDQERDLMLFRVVPWRPGDAVGLQPRLSLEVEIAEMAADRPWGSLSRRLCALHKAVDEYIEGLAAFALGLTEPSPESVDT